MELEAVAFEDFDWTLADRFADRLVFQTPEWVRFIAESQGAEPALALLSDGGEPVGLFTALFVKRLGLRVMGSPLPGWTTAYMGFNLVEGASRRDAVGALRRQSFTRMDCVHFELADRWLSVADLEGLDLTMSTRAVLEIDLRRSEDEILGAMTSACRRCIRKAEKSGVVIEEASGIGFAEEYHHQLRGVFARQGLVPTYPVERVRALIRHLEPTGHILLLRARNRAGECIATGIFAGMNRAAYFWGGASIREQQFNRPNEAIFWYAMRYWRSRGIDSFDLGGAGDYKMKYGPVVGAVPFARASRWRMLSLGRAVASRAATLRQQARGRVERG